MGDSLLGYILMNIARFHFSPADLHSYPAVQCKYFMDSWGRKGRPKSLRALLLRHCNLQRSCKYYCNLPKDNLGFI